MFTAGGGRTEKDDPDDPPEVILGAFLAFGYSVREKRGTASCMVMRSGRC